MPGPRERLTGVSDPSEQRATPARPEGHVAPDEDAKVLDLAEHLATVLREQFSDPAAALEFIAAKAGLMIAVREASTGGAMPTPTETAARHRPYRGFDVERRTYERIQPELLKRFEGQFVAIVGEEWIGPWMTAEDAERAGYKNFGLGPLYIKQVTAVERPAVTTRGVVICRT